MSAVWVSACELGGYTTTLRCKLPLSPQLDGQFWLWLSLHTHRCLDPLGTCGIPLGFLLAQKEGYSVGPALHF